MQRVSRDYLVYHSQLSCTPEPLLLPARCSEVGPATVRCFTRPSESSLTSNCKNTFYLLGLSQGLCETASQAGFSYRDSHSAIWVDSQGLFWVLNFCLLEGRVIPCFRWQSRLLNKLCCFWGTDVQIFFDNMNGFPPVIRNRWILK